MATTMLSTQTISQLPNLLSTRRNSEPKPKTTILLGATPASLACAFALLDRGEQVVVVDDPSYNDGVFVQEPQCDADELALECQLATNVHHNIQQAIALIRKHIIGADVSCSDSHCDLEDVEAVSVSGNIVRVKDDIHSWQAALQQELGAERASKLLADYQRKQLGFDSSELAQVPVAATPYVSSPTSSPATPRSIPSLSDASNLDNHSTEDSTCEIEQRLMQCYTQGHVDAVDPDAKCITFTNGRVLHFDRVISTLPLPELCRKISNSTSCKSLTSLGEQLSETFDKASVLVTHHTIGLVVAGPVPACVANVQSLHFADTETTFLRARFVNNTVGLGSTSEDEDEAHTWTILFDVVESPNMTVEHSKIVDEAVRFAEAHGLTDPQDNVVEDTFHFHAAPRHVVLEQNGSIVQESLRTLALHDVHCLGSLVDSECVTFFTSLQDSMAAAKTLLSSTVFADSLLPTTSKVCCVFMHSLQRNGANNCALFTVQAMLGSRRFCIVSPSDGPMRGDFDELGVPVTILDPKKPNYADGLSMVLSCSAIDLVLANTIMRADVVVTAESMGLPTAWVIHEAWPPEQFEYYAKEVFMMSHIDSNLIRNAFSMCNRVIFPSNVQRDIYKELLREGCVETIYNGIPLDALDAHSTDEVRREARAKLGYTDEDFVVLHIGTICHRKGQLYTAKAFVEMCGEVLGSVQACTTGAAQCSSPKLLMVGARYIRDHEIKYIDEIKAVLNASPFADRVSILDIQKNPCPFYAAADVVLVPSLNEVLPLVICEAMAMQKPVVCSKIDAIPEALDHDREGLLIKPADVEDLKSAILRLYRDPTLRKEMGKLGRERVLRQFSYSACQTRYRQLFESMSQHQDLEL